MGERGVNSPSVTRTSMVMAMTRGPRRRWMRHAQRPLRSRCRLRRPAPDLRGHLDPGHPDLGQHARLGCRSRRHACAGRSRPTAPSPASCARGTSAPGPARDHTVKVDVTGLEPRPLYYYRFVFGKRRAAPSAAPGPRPRPRRPRPTCASASCPAPTCQAGWFSAYRHLANRNDLHAVLHLGDYIYEYGPGEYGYGQGDVRHPPARPPPTRSSTSPTTGSGTRSTSRTPTCSACTRSTRSSPPGTTTSPPTTPGRAAPVNHNAGEGSWAATAGRQPARRTTSGCRCGSAAPPRSVTAPRSTAGCQYGDLVEISMLDLRTYRDKQLAAQVDPAHGRPGPHHHRPRPARLAQGLADPPGRPSGSWSATR